MTKHEIKADLQDIRYYYTHKAMFDRAEDTGFKQERKGTCGLSGICHGKGERGGVESPEQLLYKCVIV